MTGHIRRRGKSSFEIKFDIGTDPTTGKRRVRYHTVKGTKRDAERKLAELTVSVHKGDYVDASKMAVASHVEQRIEAWESAEDISPKTAERYRELLANQITPFIGQNLIQKLRTIDVEDWHLKLKTRGRKDGKGGLSKRTVRHAHMLLSKTLKDAARHDLIIKNVAAEEGAPSVDDDEEIIILTPEQLSALPVRLKGTRMFTRAITLVYTGLRRGELLGLRWSRLDLEAKTADIQEAMEQTKRGGIRFKTPKTKNSRRKITLPDIVVEALREHRRQQLELRIAAGLGKMPADALVFGEIDGTFQTPRAMTSEWRDCAKKHNMAGVPLHALRHTHASQLIDQGVDIVTVSRRLGHASPAITLKIYAHLFRKDDGKAATAINAALSGGGGA